LLRAALVGNLILGLLDAKDKCDIKDQIAEIHKSLKIISDKVDKMQIIDLELIAKEGAKQYEDWLVTNKSDDLRASIVSFRKAILLADSTLGNDFFIDNVKCEEHYVQYAFSLFPLWVTACKAGVSYGDEDLKKIADKELNDIEL